MQGIENYELCVLNWPLPIGAFQDQCKQTTINKYSHKHNYPRLRIPTGRSGIPVGYLQVQLRS